MVGAKKDLQTNLDPIELYGRLSKENVSLCIKESKVQVDLYWMRMIHFDVGQLLVHCLSDPLYLRQLVPFCLSHIADP